MATLNLSVEGPSIKAGYLSVINGNLPPASSPTSSIWALYTVKAPLQNAFQATSVKDSILRVQATGAGELGDLFDDFSEGHVQFAFIKVRDPNSGLPKYVLIGWCGGGVPERTKGYFTSHLNSAAQVLRGYHVQLTARSDSDLDPSALLQKVADASGVKYSTDNSKSPSAEATTAASPDNGARKAIYTPSTAAKSAAVVQRRSNPDDDNDGWGPDAPPISRTQLEKVAPAYKPTKLPPPTPRRGTAHHNAPTHSADTEQGQSEVVNGAYQPVGKIDIAALRAQGNWNDKPAPVKGAYEPIGKVDIAAIKARAQKPVEDDTAKSTDLKSPPRPGATNRGSTVPFFLPPAAAVITPQINTAQRTFANQDGKTPAQLWAEKKARQGDNSGASASNQQASAPSSSANKPGWKSEYTGKSWQVKVPTYSKEALNGDDDTEAGTGQSALPVVHSSGTSVKDELSHSKISTEPQDDPKPVAQKPVAHVDDPAHSLEKSTESSHAELSVPENKDHYGTETDASRNPIRGPPPQTLNREPSNQSVDVAAPVVSNQRPVVSSEQPVLPSSPHENTNTEILPPADSVESPDVSSGVGQCAKAQYDYEKAEDNELDLQENELITHIEMLDADWWLGTNSRGARGLFPSNYVELVSTSASDIHLTQDELPASTGEISMPLDSTRGEPTAAESSVNEATAVALYDYEAAEDNELSFPEGAIITGLAFPDEDWWFGHYDGHSGLFPANYVKKES